MIPVLLLALALSSPFLAAWYWVFGVVYWRLAILNAILDGRLRRWLEGQRIKLDPWGSYMHSTYLDDASMARGVHESEETRSRLGGDRKGANLMFSETADGLHYPMLDIDLPCRWVPSSTPGKGHLYIGKAVTWDQLKTLLVGLEMAGIIHPNYVKHSVIRGYTCLRPPWVHKPRNFADRFSSDHFEEEDPFLAALQATIEAPLEPYGTLDPGGRSSTGPV